MGIENNIENYILEDEVWIDIIGYEGLYKISNYGNVISCSKNRNLKNTVKSTGYIEFRLYKNGVGTYHRAHKLVALHFLTNPNNYNIINHKDGEKQNNYYKNLEWCTSAHNTQHAYKNGLMVGKKGEGNVNALLSESEVVEIYINKNNLELIEMSNLYNVSKSLISMIWSGKRWKYLTKNIDTFNRKFSNLSPFKFVKGTSPKGENFYAKGLGDFQKIDTELKSRIKMIDCANGLREHYKNWKFEYVSYDEYKITKVADSHD